MVLATVVFGSIVAICVIEAIRMIYSMRKLTKESKK